MCLFIFHTINAWFKKELNTAIFDLNFEYLDNILYELTVSLYNIKSDGGVNTQPITTAETK